MVHDDDLAVAGMSAADVVARGRARAESLMTDTVRVTRASGAPVTDPETAVVSRPVVEVYAGPGRVQGRATDSESVEGVQVYVLTDAVVQLPVSVAPIADDEIQVTASRMDEHLVGRIFRVKAAPRKTHATMTRCEVEEVAA